jgi:DNA replication protein DnaC
MRCWAADYCKKKSPDNCHEFCLAYVLMEALYTQSGMPKRYQFPQSLTVPPIDTESFGKVKTFIGDVVNNIEDGRGLYLYGSRTGTGKTSLACAIMNAYFRKVVFVSNLECMGLYIHVPSFLEEYREAFDDSEKQRVLDEKIRNLYVAKLVIWDDIGAEKPSEWVRERVLTILDSRVGNMLSNIFTSNLSVAQLSESTVLGVRVASRIAGCTEQLEFKGADKRGLSDNG